MKTIVENNRMILDYMQVRPKFDAYTKQFNWSDGIFFMCSEKTEEKVMESVAKYAKYNTDWNWVMPCITKCLEGEAEKTTEDEIRLTGNIYDALQSQNLTQCYDAVCECIEYINQNSTAGNPKVNYVLGDDRINGVKISDKIRDEELFEYEIRDREDFINELIGWISEATKDKELMKSDLVLLISLNDGYIFSSLSTNHYIYKGHPDFESTCEELLELNSTL